MVVDEMAGLVEKGESERTKVAAAKTLVAADNVNAKRESTAAGGKSGNTTNVNVGVVVDPLAMWKQAQMEAARDEIEERLQLEEQQTEAVELKNGFKKET